MMMMLLAVLALGLLSLSTIELRRSAAGTARAIARANARLALQLAIGSLQKNLGPDGRVCATASLFDSDPASPGVEGVNHPHWTGVWSASKPDTKGGMVTPIKRDDSDGGLRDERATGGWPRTETLDWLVSRPAGMATPDPRTISREGDWIRLVSTGTDKDDVWVPSVAVGDSSAGRYAWWVGDEGGKAKVNLPDGWAGKLPDPANPGNGGYNHWLASQKNEPVLVDPSLHIEEAKKAKVVTLRNQQLGSTATPEAIKGKFHDFTTTSLGLPVDVAHARLKRDLTAYFASDGSIPDLGGSGKVTSPGIADDDRLVGPANPAAAAREGVNWADTRHQTSAPRFGLLRRWSRYASIYAMEAGNMAIAQPKAENPPLLNSDDSYDGTNKVPVAIGQFDTPSVSPVLVEGSIYYQLVAENSGTATAASWQLRAHIYPRVVIWNPYNLALQIPASSLMLHTNGGKTVELTMADGTKSSRTLSWASGGALAGAFYFGLNAITLKPGACAVFSPTQQTAYNGGNPGANLLSASVPPSPDRGFTVAIGSPGAVQPIQFREAPTGFQAQDYRMLWKNGSSGSTAAFQSLPQLSFVSCSMQYGDDNEVPVEWSNSTPVPIQAVTGTSYPVVSIPDVRTRDGFRLRWFTETPSNKIGSGSLANTNHFDIAPLGNWNPRATYTLRTPYENVTDVAPQFFGAYTRDLFDGAVSWGEMMPVPKDGIQQTWPFGQAIESPGPLVLFDVPRKETGIASLAQFQHAKLSEFIWHPSYAVGNSLPDPRLEDRTDRSAPVARDGSEKAMNGWTKAMLGYASGRTGGSQGNEQWAFYARWSIGNLPATDAVVHDLSYEVNRNLWDDFFLSTGSQAEKQSFIASGAALPNGRMRLVNRAGSADQVRADLSDFHRAASRLAIDGAFNVNSTSVAAWKAVLGGTRGTSTSAESTIFPRLLNAPAGEWKTGTAANGKEAWGGSRILDDGEVGRLAEAIVTEVKKRGPFLSLSDFVNRRLAKDDTGKAGALEAAIRSAGLNSSFEQAYPLVRDKLKDYADTLDNIPDGTRLDPQLMPSSKAWGAPAYLTQADILQPLGPQLSARSDTFVIRSYGDSRSSSGTIEARAWCEAVVQRLPEPVTPDSTGLNPLDPGGRNDFGRRFIITGFRWLNSSDI
ncbi:hypothetical protein KBB96_15795 [Luteolibacter ambystomatis]|uniref:Uncharacterized protein n=1 Tax=Luteolibacter ambystomatis TaxID=2824561 RepID=A0A975IZV3_9BACT|nr:hypothetical protein [Luteolibacter ambystomatis]QUE50325.1 hypothetical protein KBB96_15795 [Luteolibacter ambystomatis]